MFLTFVIFSCIILLIFWYKIYGSVYETFCGWVIVVSILVLFIHLMTYAESINTVAEMETFYDNNQIVYKQAVEKFPKSGKTVTVDNTSTIYLLSYDMTKDIIDYNTKLTWYHKYQKHWFFGGFVARVSNRLEYISI